MRIKRIHHLTIAVRDLEGARLTFEQLFDVRGGDTVRELASQGVRVSEPVELGPGVRSAFVTMAATHGLSVQLVEVAGAADQPVSVSAGQPVAESASKGE